MRSQVLLSNPLSTKKLQNIPGFKELPAQLSGQLTKDFSQTAYSNIAKSVEDRTYALTEIESYGVKDQQLEEDFGQ